MADTLPRFMCWRCLCVCVCALVCVCVSPQVIPLARLVGFLSSRTQQSTDLRKRRNLLVAGSRFAEVRRPVQRSHFEGSLVHWSPFQTNSKEPGKASMFPYDSGIRGTSREQVQWACVNTRYPFWGTCLSGGQKEIKNSGGVGLLVLSRSRSIPKPWVIPYCTSKLGRASP